MRVVVAAVYCLLVIASAGCQSSKLSGDVFATMQNGDVKRGADLPVALVPASPAFVTEWEQVQAGYEREVAPLVSQYDSLDAKYDKMTFLDSRRSETLQMTHIGRTKWAPLQRQYTEAAFQILAKHTKATTRTDVNGHFEFPDLQPGRYFLHVRFSVYRSLMYWTVPVDVRGNSKVSLSNSNAQYNSPLLGRTYTAF